MAEQRIELKTFMVRMRCEWSKPDSALMCSGELQHVQTPNDLMNHTPAQYFHRCDRCGYGVLLQKQYPSIEHEEVKE